jgi:cell division protein FtsL
MWRPKAGTSIDEEAGESYRRGNAGKSCFPERPLQGLGENCMRLRSPFFIIIALTFVALFFLNTWQGYRYQELEQEVGNLELEQKDWLEKNKKVIAALAVLSSPERVEALAADKLGLKPLKAEDVIKVNIKGGRGD